MKAETGALLESGLRGLEPCREAVVRAFELLLRCFSGGGKVLVCGNGGSAADSEHIVGELMKGFRRARPLPAADRERLQQAFPADASWLADRLQGGLPAVSLVSPIALTTAILNDLGGELVYAQQVYGLGREGDALIGISTSGLARNVLNALKVARAFGLRTIGLTGRGGGDFPALCDAAIVSPAGDTAEVQAHHLQIYHALCGMIEAELFPL